jgi:hypothetical protein
MGHQASADMPRAPCNRSEVVAIGALRRLLQIASSAVSLDALPRGYRAALAPSVSAAARGGYQPFKGFLPAIFTPLSTPPPAGKLLVLLRPLTTQIRRVVVSLCACDGCIIVIIIIIIVINVVIIIDGGVRRLLSGGRAAAGDQGVDRVQVWVGWGGSPTDEEYKRAT